MSPFKYECSFCSWGNTDMYNPNDQESFAGIYDWGGVNAQEPYYEGQPYGSTQGAALTANFGPAFDAARQHLSAPWRIPTSAEFKELIDNCDIIDAAGNIVSGASSVNGIVGLRLRSKINGKIIFFPASGAGAATAWGSRITSGYYWSSSWHSEQFARGLNFNASSVIPQGADGRYLGFAIRPVF